jgi:nitroreductase
MEFKQVVNRRRMVRNYSDEPVEESVVMRIVETARRGPSAGFTQGVHFVVVTREDLRHAIAEAAGEEIYAASGFDRWMSNAPVHIAVCVREADYHDRYSEQDKLQPDGTELPWPIPYWWVDAGAALMLLLLAAVDEGLSAGFFGWHRLGGVERILGFPGDVTPIGVVTLGHGAPDRPSSSLSRGRRPAHEVVHHNGW